MLGWRLPRRIGRPGVVTSSASVGEAPGQRRAAKRRAALGEGGLDRTADRVRHGPDPRPVVGRQRADPAQDRGQAPLLAEDVQLERLERGDIGARRDRRQGVVTERFEVARQVGEFHVLLGVKDGRQRRDQASAISPPRSEATLPRAISPRIRPWRARRSSRRSRRPGWPGRPGSCGRSRRRPS